MSYFLSFTPIAKQNLKELKTTNLEKRFKAVSKALKYLAENPRHPPANTPIFSLFAPNGEKVFEAYADRIHPLPIVFFLLWTQPRGNSSFHDYAASLSKKL